jgi:hypothetical protein
MRGKERGIGAYILKMRGKSGEKEVLKVILEVRSFRGSDGLFGK